MKNQQCVTTNTRKALVAAALVGLVAPTWMHSAHAGAGIGVNAAGDPVDATYYANSPAGDWTDFQGVVHNSGTAMRKFVDCLPSLLAIPTSCVGADGVAKSAINIPIAVPSTPYGSPYADADYYEIGVVEYTQRMHSDLPKETRLRGYVQLVPASFPGAYPLTKLDGSPLTLNGVQLYSTAKPTYLGPVIAATRGQPVRIKYTNLLPTGAAGELFIPVDRSLPGAGVGPDGVNSFLDNRISVHLHGGHVGWVSDGTPHQWTVPVGETSTTYLNGASFKNVPDMADPGQGSGTLYYNNDQPARLMFYHDHASGITRLNVYVGIAAGYLVSDPAGTGEWTVPALANLGLAGQIPLVIQDKSFVPNDIATQDAKWDTMHWGQPGDLWFPHVYETNQDPNSVDGTKPVGRWDWGPWFWPISPSQYALPTGVYGDASTTPEAFMDTPVVNGMAYPSLTVDPKAYRFRILNAGNDRMLNLGLYVAEPLTLALTNGGAGYFGGAMVNIDAPPAGGEQATATATVSTGTVIDIPITNMGEGYLSTPLIHIDPPASGTAATAVAIVGNAGAKVGTIVGIRITNGGSGYLTAPNVSIDTPTCAIGPGCVTAIVGPTATLAPAGVITALTVTNPGSGYLAPPAMTIVSTDPLVIPTVDATAYATLGTEVRMVNFDSSYVPPAEVSPDGTTTFPSTGGPLGTGWGKPDGRVGGVPDPATAGPAIIQIGNEGGLLPNPTIIPSTVINYEYNRRSATVLNILEHGLYLGGAERADAIIDFCQYAGKTLILYNDAPAPVPAGDPRLDYYTGNEDFSAFGGMPSTKAGFGPNTRTIMQIKVNPGVCTTAFDPASLFTDLPKAYAATQETPVVGESAYNAAFGTNYADNYAHIQVGSATQPNFTFQDGSGPNHVSLSLLNGGAGYRTAPAVTIGAPAVGGTQATASATLSVSAITITNAGTGYTTPPAVTLTAAPIGGVNAQALATVSGGKITAIKITNPGWGYTTMPTVTITGGGGKNGAAVTSGTVTPANIATATPSGLRLLNAGSGYLAAPTVTLAAPVPPKGVTGVTALASSALSDVISMPIENKAIQELFEPTFGRMNATLGVELPFAANTQTTIPLNYVDPATETIMDGETQIWKITHNGVDTHPVHFHLVNVQLINRVGWDGTLKPPRENELGWKETLKMNPLEDVIVAVRARKPLMKFGLPESKRMLDPQQPAGSTMGFTQINPWTGNPALVSNVEASFGWEYVWHCHILGHEENDFMRPVIFHVPSTVPAAPTGLVAAAVGGQVTLTWADPTPVATAIAGDPINEVGFTIERADNNGFTQNVVSLNAPANSTSFVDSTVVVGTKYYYRISTYNAAGSSATTANVNVTP